jgi:photosystem II stability/assembly factor-like uncharacterized protein
MGLDVHVASLVSLATDPQVLVGAAPDSGIARSEDLGKSWRYANQGLGIPRATAVFAFPFMNRIYASTPAGLYFSDNQGKSWSFANLRVILRESPNTFEVGGADYLLAYWMGRYYGFIEPDE